MRRINIVALILVFSICFFINSAEALQEPTYRECINTTHLFEEKIIYNSITGQEIWNETTYCPFNCSNSDCYEPYDVAPEIFIAIAFFCAMMGIMFAYLTIKMGDSGDQVLPILFIAIALIFSMLGVFSLVQLGANSSLDVISAYMSTGYQILSGTFFVVIFYIIIRYAVSVFGIMEKLTKKNFMKKGHKTGTY